MIIHSSSILSWVLAQFYIPEQELSGVGHVFYDPTRSNFGAPSKLGVSITL
jgi:hypothetical protein